MSAARIEELFGDYPEPVRTRFSEFHEQNPQVFRLFKRLCQQMWRAGRRRYSARTIFEVMRWNHDLSTSGDAFEINGDFVPIYARLLVYHHALFEGFFEFRQVKSRGIGSQEQHEREATI